MRSNDEISRQLPLAVTSAVKLGKPLTGDITLKMKKRITSIPTLVRAFFLSFFLERRSAAAYL
ncbi:MULTISPECIES: hypothetical protein [Paraburkholderia]|uniref:hypothetical protein n=1 Tax=Paraburkholderia TaxID=1822464 RepID=UPI00224EF303|nr:MULTISPECIES: hypothetical protein [Paraburkholderia]MCX4175940.1 hypothetical protein [Paraburkholderia madseniana]MDQ6463934.1 hypothetical protein [Paraburkholderia madseniana]